MAAAIWIPIAISAASMGAQYTISYVQARKQKPQRIDAGRNNDVRLMTSELGAYIPRGWGRFRLAPIVLAHTGRREVKSETQQTSGGKGAPKQKTITTNYSYYTTLALLGCAGVTQNIEKIWGDTTLYFNQNPDPNLHFFEAEDGVRAGGASITADAACSSGYKVTSIGGGGTLTITAPSAQVPLDPTDSSNTLLTVYYKSATPKTLRISYDGGANVSYSLPASSGTEVATYPIQITGHPTSYAFSGAAATVDLDRLTVYYSYTSTLPVDLPVTGIEDPYISFPNDEFLPYAKHYYRPIADVNGMYQFSTAATQNIRIYTGTETQTADSAIIAYLDTRYGAGQGVDYASAYRGLTYAVLEEHLMPNGQLENFTMEINQGTTSVSTILADLYAEKGIDVSELNLDALSGLTRQGLLVNQMTSPASIIAQLEDWYRFKMVEMDGKIKACLNTSSVLATITSDDLRAHLDGDEMPNFDDEISEISEESLPATVYVSHLDNETVGLDYHNNSQQAEIIGTNAQDVISLSFPFVATPTEAKGVAEKILIEAHLRRHKHAFFAMPEWAKYTPGDTVNLQLENTTHKVQITKKQMALPGAVHFNAESVDEVNVNANVTASPTLQDKLPDTAKFPANTELFIFESEPVELTQDGLGVIVGVSSKGLGKWAGASLYSKIGTEDYKLSEIFEKSSPVGVAQSTLANWTSAGVDTTHSFTVYFYEDVEVETVTAGEITANPILNLMRLGDEWLQFRTAVAASLPTGSLYKSAWTFSNLTRGVWSTQTAKSTHGASEKCLVYVNTRFVKFNSAYKDQSISFIAPTFGQSTDNAEVKTLTLTGKSLAGVLAPSDLDDRVGGLGVPTLEEYPAANATNTGVQVKIGNYGRTAKYRKIIESASGAMTSPTTTIYSADDYGTKILPETMILTKTSDPTAVHRYYQVAHSTDNINYSTASTVLDVLFTQDYGDWGVPELNGLATVSLLGSSWIFTFPKPKKNGYTAKLVQYALLNDTNYKTTTSSYTSSATSITLNNVIGFPSEGRVYVGGGPNDGTDEIFSYTGISGNTLTGVTRGRDDTTARALTNGNVIFQIQFQGTVGEVSEYQLPQISNTLLLIYRWQNDYRAGGSDGFSLWSGGVYAYGSGSGSTNPSPSAPTAEPPAPPAGYEDPLDPVWYERKNPAY